jgi:transcriptional regulator with XRE-family HTH domain
MTQTISERLKELRDLRGLSQEALAQKARLNKQTIYRLENGRQPPRQKTIQRLAPALGVEPEVLTGEKPIPSDRARPPESKDPAQLNIRLDPFIRNAFSLLALRYRVPIKSIVKVAPLLFFLAAEESLKRRRKILEEFEVASSHAEDLRANLPHLPLGWTATYYASKAEEMSIANRDLFASDLFASETKSDPLSYGWPEEYNEEKDNPFSAYLKELAEAHEDIAVEAVGPTRTEYEVGRSEAIELAGGDERLAEGLLNGWGLIHEIPRNLLGKGAVSERVEWLRRKVEQAEQAAAEQARMGIGLEALNEIE